MGFFHLRHPESAASNPIWAAYQTLDRTQWLKPAEIEALQFRNLRTLLLHCYENVPYYRSPLESAGFPSRAIESFDDFRKLPLLTRDLYQKNYADLQAKSLPPGIVQVSTGHTSGTNGVPIEVRKTNYDGVMWNALYLRDFEWSGFDMRSRLASIRFIGLTPEKLAAAMRGAQLPFWNNQLQSLLATGPSFGMEIRQDPRRQIEWLQQVRPNYLLSLPTNLELLAGLMQETGQRLPELRAIQAVAENLPDWSKNRIESAFGVPVKNLYSCTEAGYVASPCPEGHGMHVHAENVLTEVLDENDRSCEPGQTGRLVLTSLTNFATPFIRYDILDYVTLAAVPCSCGRGLPLWTSIEGRSFPTLRLPDGRQKSSIAIVRNVRMVGGLHQFQVIVRRPDHVICRIVPDSTWTDDHAQRMRQAIQEEFESPIRVDVETMPVLERGAGGKLKLLVVESG